MWNSIEQQRDKSQLPQNGSLSKCSFLPNRFVTLILLFGNLEGCNESVRVFSTMWDCARWKRTTCFEENEGASIRDKISRVFGSRRDPLTPLTPRDLACTRKARADGSKCSVDRKTLMILLCLGLHTLSVYTLMRAAEIYRTVKHIPSQKNAVAIEKPFVRLYPKTKSAK